MVRGVEKFGAGECMLGEGGGGGDADADADAVNEFAREEWW